MREYYEYNMHIIDNEFGDEYDYIAYFEDHMVADRFIAENENVGNVIVYNAHPKRVFLRPEDLPMA
jgi:hypothetical protein